MTKKVTILVALMLVASLLLCGCDEMASSASTAYTDQEIAQSDSVALVDKLNIGLKRQNPVEGEVPENIHEAIIINNSGSSPLQSFMYELPDIEGYEPVVKGTAPLDVEIFLPLEDNGSGIEKLVCYVANKYNAMNTDTSITIRSLEASLAEDFIRSGNYIPKGYIASNALYKFFLEENDINVQTIDDRLVGNTIGVVISNDTLKLLQDSYNSIDFSAIVSACMDGKIQIGYTNPTNNPTGLNFVVSMLSYFDANNPFSMEATTDFSAFQGKVSSVAYSYFQMKEAFNRETINALVTEYQAYLSDQALKGYAFIPFGVRQDYPLLGIGTLSAEEEEVLRSFANLFDEAGVEESCSEYANNLGFNLNDDYQSSVNVNNYEGIISEVLSFWKVNKTSSKKVAIMFVCDVSGSMDGRRIKSLKSSAINAMQYIKMDSLVGLMSFNNSVYYNIPLLPFDEMQQSLYYGTIESLRAGGGTATNNALLMALKVMEEARRADPDIKPLIILLSDGETGSGYRLTAVTNLIASFDIPIYTIGYEGDMEELKRIASINNGVYINASTDDVGYILKSLFNAEA